MAFLEHYERTKKVQVLEKKLVAVQQELIEHVVYKDLMNIHNLRIFMGYHVFAVWDYMTLLKGLQRHITCTRVPWKPSTYPKELIRLINSMVLEEESDLDQNDQACDHFSLYVRAMEEMNADSKPIKSFLKNLDTDILSTPLKECMQFSINIAQNYPLHILAGVFYFGREQLIPRIFKPYLEGVTSYPAGTLTPTLSYYLRRHMDLDGNQQVARIMKLLDVACMDSPKAYQEALSYGIQACLLRKKLWDKALESMVHYTPQTIPQISLF